MPPRPDLPALTPPRYDRDMDATAMQFGSLPGFTPVTTLGPHREAEYAALPEGEPIELIFGRLVISPAPDLAHQFIVMILTRWILDVADKSGGRAVIAPYDVRLADHSIVQPDLLYVRKPRPGSMRKRLEGPPDLAIEILSASNVRRDRVDKLALYAEFGVAEYWIVDAHERQIDFLINRNGKFEVQTPRDDRYQSPVHAELAIDLAALWNELAVRLGDDA